MPPKMNVILPETGNMILFKEFPDSLTGCISVELFLYFYSSSPNVSTLSSISGAVSVRSMRGPSDMGCAPASTA